MVVTALTGHKRGFLVIKAALLVMRHQNLSNDLTHLALYRLEEVLRRRTRPYRMVKDRIRVPSLLAAI